MFRESVNGAVESAVPVSIPSTLNCTFVVLVDTLVETAITPETVAPDAGEVMEIFGAPEFLTLSATDGLVAMWPAGSAAMAVSECEPSDNLVVSRERSKGALVTAALALVPSTLNCTLLVSAETLVVTATAPETVAPEAGEEIETAGAAVLSVDVPFFEFALVRPTQPAQYSASSRSRQ